MNPLLFKVLLVFTLPAEQAVIFENFALKYDVSIEIMVEEYIRHRLELENGYVEVQREYEEDGILKWRE